MTDIWRAAATARVAANELEQSRLAVACFAVMALASWVFLHLYWGIVHDAVQYTMQGLAHLRPDLYGTDVYLRYGSQDRFTLFFPIYAQTIHVFGVDHAAAVLTLVSQTALLVAFWMLARCLMSRNLALMALALFAGLEMPYGAGGTFHVIEDFVSPRLLSEAIVIAAVAATLERRTGWAIALLGLATLIHPLMASAGIVWFVWMRWVAARPKSAASGAALGLAALIILSTTAFGRSQRFDDTWLRLAINRAPYLVLSNWSALDYSRISPQLATLCLAAVANPNATRKLSLAGLGIAAAGLALSWIGGDWLHFVLVIQAQPWRWLWLASVLGTAMLPVLFTHLWSLGHVGRAAIALLLTVYLFQDDIYAPIVAALAIAVGALATRSSTLIDRRQRLLIVWGALGLLAIGLAWDVANRSVYAQIPYVNFAGMQTVSLLRGIARSSCIPVIALAAWWWLSFHRPTLLRLRIMLVCAIVTLLVLLPAGVKTWSKVSFPSVDFDAFSRWRKLIPGGTEVLWAEHPLQTWVLLEDPSYYSVAQVSTTLYSRQAALDLHQRSIALASFLASEGLVAASAGVNPALAQVCASPGLSYIVTHHTFDVAPLDALPVEVALSYRGLKLYQCSKPD